MNKIDYLKSAIAKTGYPLEIHISSLLDKTWDSVLNTDSYYDREEQKLRDVDIITSSSYTDKEEGMTLQTGMVIECKKTEKFAWVFFTRPFEFSVSEIEGQYLDKIQCISKNLEKSDFLNELLFQHEKLHYANFKNVSVAYSELLLSTDSETKKSRNSHDIFEAQNQVKKYIDCQIEQLINNYSKPNSSMPVFFFFPCIVFDGDLFEAIVSEDGLELKDTNHLLLSSTYKSPYANFERIVLIDIVKKEYFNSYQKEILKDRDHLQQCFYVVSDTLKAKIELVTEYLPEK
jgi:hypothetical protein